MGHSEYFQQLQIPSLEPGLPANPAVLSTSDVFCDRASYGSVPAGWNETSRGGGRTRVNLLSVSVLCEDSSQQQKDPSIPIKSWHLPVATINRR
jgi:hypothetical protein